MKGSDYLKWIRRLVILGAVVAAITASTAGAVRPADDPGTAVQNRPTVVNRPTTLGLKADGLRLQAVAQAYRENQQASPPDVFERYAAVHAYGIGLSSTSIGAMPPPNVSGAALAAETGTVSQSNGFDWTDWAIGIGAGLGLVLLLGIGFVMSRQMRHHPQPA